MTKQDYNNLCNCATQITVAFTQQAVLPDNGFSTGKDFGNFWGECLGMMVAAYNKATFKQTPLINRDSMGRQII
jgi:hypothetical protein